MLQEEEPASTPTIHIKSKGSKESGTDPVFAAYARIVDNMRSKGDPLTFPVLDKSVKYCRSNIAEFVERLACVCNHPAYESPDAQFVVKARIAEELALRVGWEGLPSSKDTLVQPDLVWRCFDNLRDRGEVTKFRVAVDYSKNAVFVEVGDLDSKNGLEGTVVGRHKIGVFALLTKGSGHERCVVLKQKLKPPWPYDVPGGKVASSDTSLRETVSREIFEELGIMLPAKGLSDVIGVKYDKRSQKEGVPVIALYFHHELTEAESKYIDEFLPPDAEEAHRYPLVLYRLKALASRKSQHRQARSRDVDDAEAECHAPLEAVVRVIEMT